MPHAKCDFWLDSNCEEGLFSEDKHHRESRSSAGPGGIPRQVPDTKDCLAIDEFANTKLRVLKKLGDPYTEFETNPEAKSEDLLAAYKIYCDALQANSKTNEVFTDRLLNGARTRVLDECSELRKVHGIPPPSFEPSFP